jgi:hypothetical protein
LAGILVLSLGWVLLRCRFKGLKTLLFYAVCESASGEFPVYKKSRVDPFDAWAAKNIILLSHLESLVG